eukprot:CAMPEP_0172533800 /NCGR_PEP_ID=MMETSP1067-20121228/6380_1 /TAXON_ID=265564 ORGANISM="Thalassiosira punctigera, Strain Tpunct2005C2" /NCGR_SAMPLE_ID=MMETSP1067 /ASSEMBLY_ACC=CAM_ASM_000444 /LENGTH=575 /DNA_ID=CAMNT_0013318497 /DNA_START=84 /DNA_END=1811 /DNA_ORIENTATION=+
MAATGPSSPDTTKETAAAAAAAAATAAATKEGASNDAATNDAAASSQCAATTASSYSYSAVATDASAPAAATPTTTPTYFATKRSKAYALSKQLLASGSLDDALSTLEMTLQLSRKMLANSTKLENDDGGGDEIELHESLAPLYYLYGTTLLYSVEESDVMMASNQRGGTPADMEVDGSERSDDGGEGNEPDDDEVGGGREAEVAPIAADPAEDLQIAWENLDLARSIVSRLVAGFHDIASHDDEADGEVALKREEKGGPAASVTAEYSLDQQTDLLLDLAQIHARLGDLQRANANVLPCIDDYELALRLRVKCLGRFDRKVADVHFSLAGACAEAPSKIGESEGRVDRFVQELGGGGNSDAMDTDDKHQLSEGERAEFRRRSLEHYLACGVAFAGIMAGMCGEDAEKLTSAGDVGGSAPASAAASAASGAASSDRPAEAMAALRRRVSELRPSEKEREEFDDLREMMDEIQEAMDTAEETEEGLKSLGEMKANEMKKHEAKRDGGEGAAEETEEEGGGTTTIGFGAAGDVAAAGANVGFGSDAAASAAPTMLVVKKKKKKPQAADDHAKRLKSN